MNPGPTGQFPPGSIADGQTSASDPAREFVRLSKLNFKQHAIRFGLGRVALFSLPVIYKTS
jgi:hypothetical protein